MKFTCTPSTIKNTLQTVSKIAPSKPSYPILSGVLLAVQGNAITMSATDLDQSIKATVDGIEVYGEGSIVVPKRFLEVLSKLPNETVIFEVDDKASGKQLTIQYGKNKFNLNCFDTEEFPQMPEVEGLAWKMDFDPKKVAFAAAKDEVRGPVFQAVHIDMEAGYAVAMSNPVFAIQKIPFIEGGGAYNIPAGFINKLPAGTELMFGSNMVAAISGNYVHTSRLIGGKYFNYKQILDREPTTTVKISALELLETVERAALIKNAVSFSFSGFTATVSASSEEGSVQETLAAEIEGGDIEVMISAAQLIEFLKWVDGDFVIGFTGVKSPAIVMPGEDWSGVLVPLVPAGGGH